MSRFTRYLTLSILILFVLACNAVTQPFEDAQNLAGTAQSFTTQLPMETIQAFASQIPQETLEALPSTVPTLEALASQMPDFENYFDPQGTPLSEWNGIPVMSQATAGQEFADTKTYSFKVNATIKEVQDFYTAELPKAGWEASPFSMPGTDTVAVLIYQKGENILTVTVTDVNGSIIVMLTTA